MDLIGRGQGVLETKAAVRLTRRRLAEAARDSRVGVDEVRKAAKTLCYALIGHYQLADERGWEGFTQFRLTGKLVMARDEEAANEFWNTAESCRVLAAELSGLAGIAPSLDEVVDVTQATVFARLRSQSGSGGAAALLEAFAVEMESGYGEARIGADVCAEAAREDIKALAAVRSRSAGPIARIRAMLRRPQARELAPVAW